MKCIHTYKHICCCGVGFLEVINFRFLGDNKKYSFGKTQIYAEVKGVFFFLFLLHQKKNENDFKELYCSSF